MADVFGLVPANDEHARAECMSTVFSLYDIEDRLWHIGYAPTLELRKAFYDRSLRDRIPLIIAAHENLLEQSGGPYYQGNGPFSARSFASLTPRSSRFPIWCYTRWLCDSKSYSAEARSSTRLRRRSCGSW